MVFPQRQETVPTQPHLVPSGVKASHYCQVPTQECEAKYFLPLNSDREVPLQDCEPKEILPLNSGRPFQMGWAGQVVASSVLVLVVQKKGRRKAGAAGSLIVVPAALTFAEVAGLQMGRWEMEHWLELLEQKGLQKRPELPIQMGQNPGCCLGSF